MASYRVHKLMVTFCLTVGLFCKTYGRSFLCKNGYVVPLDLFCNGFHDCNDGTDESYDYGCDIWKCGYARFSCSDGGCLPVSAYCNGKTECMNGEDERYCGLGKTMFRCDNSVLIPKHWFCDGENDCGDDSDEFFVNGCNMNCGKDKFTCSNGQCVPITLHCNGKWDCEDGLDELHCVDQLSLENCTTQQGEYLCKDGTRCISFANICDGIVSCPDASDESENCTARTDSCDLTCADPCWRTPQGPQCFCQFLDAPYETACDEVEDCEESQDACQQICSKFRGSTQCFCSEGFSAVSRTRGASCFNEVGYRNVLLYSDRESIVALNMTTLEKISVQEEGNVTSISAAHNFVYWSTSSNGVSKIFRTKVLYEGTKEIVYSKLNETSAINSIAIDWIGNNTFFTSQKLLSVCNNIGTMCSHLKYSVFGIESVALLPRKGLMFWIQNTEYKDSKSLILKSSMDGSDERLLVDENLRFSDHLVVDESSERIYWVDREQAKIESVKCNGKHRKVILPEASSVVSFTIFEGILYQTEKFKIRIFRDERILFTGVNNMKKIHIFNPLLQKTKILNPCFSCSGLCLLRPASSPRGLNCSCYRSQTTANHSPTWFSDTSPSSRSIWYSNATTSLPQAFNEHFQKPSKDGLPTTVITPNEHSQNSTSQNERYVTRERSTCEYPTTENIIPWIITFILLLCVIAMLAFYYSKSVTKKRQHSQNREIILESHTQVNTEL